jgi:4-hydroxy-2-oxoglutarate aldolase
MLPAEHHSSARTLKPGVYTPLPTFFDEDEELNLEEYEKHLIRECRYSWSPSKRALTI